MRNPHPRDGQSRPSGADELWCDAPGRIRIRFPWQQGIEADDRHSCWVRVASRQAGPRMGWQWLPRIGQEVLVDFLDGDIDRPVVQGVLYNGQGEGGVPPTPGAAHRHPGALSGFKSKEFGGAGYNQLVFDDSDAQLRIQLKSTQAASELNLGHRPDRCHRARSA